VVEHLATHRGLAIDRDSAPEPGKIVFVDRSTLPSVITPHESGRSISRE
jgi:hypothetical protein